MSEAELIFTALAELSMRQIAEHQQAAGLGENKTAVQAGGRIAGQARRQLEEQTGQPMVTGASYLPPQVQPANALPATPARRGKPRPPKG